MLLCLNMIMLQVQLILYERQTLQAKQYKIKSINRAVPCGFWDAFIRAVATYFTCIPFEFAIKYSKYDKLRWQNNFPNYEELI